FRSNIACSVASGKGDRQRLQRSLEECPSVLEPGALRESQIVETANDARQGALELLLDQQATDTGMDPAAEPQVLRGVLSREVDPLRVGDLALVAVAPA